MEKTMITGHVGKDASINTVNGRKALNFTVGVNRSWKNNEGQKMTSTNWYSCTRWFGESESIEIVKYLLKGTHVLIEGSLQPALYKNKDNQAAIDLKLNVKSIELLSKKEKEADSTNTNDTTNNSPGPYFHETNNDDLPF